jgi:hypothetical protein
VVYQGDVSGSGAGRFTYRAQSIGNPCSGVVYYIVGDATVEVTEDGELVKTYDGNQLSLVAKQFLSCNIPAGFEFWFKPISGTIEKTGKIDLKLEAADGGYSTGSATLTGTLSDAILTISGFTNPEITLDPARVHGIKLHECTYRCTP